MDLGGDTGTTARRRVAIVQEQLPRYRVPFFESLREHLDIRGIELRLLVSDAPDASSDRGDGGVVAWAETVRTARVRIADRTLVWQHHLRPLATVDLIIVEQASRNLANLTLMARSKFGGPPVAFWGHGRNLQAATPYSLSERLKRRVTSRVPWFFAYNAFSADIAERTGVPRERITVVNNAIDTRAMRSEFETLERDEVVAWGRRWGVEGSDVCVYSGGLYPDKRLPFLVDAADLARAHNPKFELLVMGGGSELQWLQEMARSRPWLHVLGPTFGRAKACAFATSRLLLMPGSVGLVVLDAFVYGTPMVTVASDHHGPEFSYLVPSNGLVLPQGSSPAAFATATNALLRDPARHAALVTGCLRAAKAYSIEDMAERFARGVVAALAAVARRERG